MWGGPNNLAVFPNMFKPVFRGILPELPFPEPGVVLGDVSESHRMSTMSTRPGLVPYLVGSMVYF